MEFLITEEVELLSQKETTLKQFLFFPLEKKNLDFNQQNKIRVHAKAYH